VVQLEINAHSDIQQAVCCGSLAVGSRNFSSAAELLDTNFHKSLAVCRFCHHHLGSRALLCLALCPTYNNRFEYFAIFKYNTIGNN